MRPKQSNDSTKKWEELGRRSIIEPIITAVSARNGGLGAGQWKHKINYKNILRLRDVDKILL